MSSRFGRTESQVERKPAASSTRPDRARASHHATDATATSAATTRAPIAKDTITATIRNASTSARRRRSAPGGSKVNEVLEAVT